MPPEMATPANHATFHGLAGTFSWKNGHAPFTPPHNARNASQWRVKVGSSQYGFDYYFGLPITNGPVLSDPNVRFANPPPNGARCWTVVEWQLAGSNTWNVGSPTDFFFQNP